MKAANEVGRDSIWLMVLGRSQFIKARKTHCKSHWRLWQQERGTGKLVKSGSPLRKQKASEASLYPSKANPIALYLPSMPQVQKVHNLPN